MQTDRSELARADAGRAARNKGEYYYEKIVQRRDADANREVPEDERLDIGRYIAISCSEDSLGRFVTGATRAQAMRRFVEKFGDVRGWVQLITS